MKRTFSVCRGAGGAAGEGEEELGEDEKATEREEGEKRLKNNMQKRLTTSCCIRRTLQGLLHNTRESRLVFLPHVLQNARVWQALFAVSCDCIDVCVRVCRASCECAQVRAQCAGVPKCAVHALFTRMIFKSFAFNVSNTSCELSIQVYIHLALLIACKFSAMSWLINPLFAMGSAGFVETVVACEEAVGNAEPVSVLTTACAAFLRCPESPFVSAGATEARLQAEPILFYPMCRVIAITTNLDSKAQSQL